MKILLNAESFGFGPSAAIACLFQHLKGLSKINEISYIGSGHSLDLQENLNYKHLYKINENDKEHFQNIVINYDLFITALDFKSARWAKEMGKKVIIYDSLTWYWKNIDSIVHEADLYIAQDFYGVEKIIIDNEIERYKIISPLIELNQSRIEKNEVLINFGGLKNPYWEDCITQDYIEKMLHYICPLLKGLKSLIVSSKIHCKEFEYYKIESLSYSEVQNKLPSIKYAITTPGLGNIFELANHDIQTLFLPPANDSQGQQLCILKDKGIIKYCIDWEEISCGEIIDYKGEQQHVLNQIKNNIESLEYNEKNQSLFFNKWQKMQHSNKNSLPQLIDCFGREGALEFIKHVSDFIQEVQNV